MDAGTFLRSLFTLRHYFIAVADAGASAAPFQTLRRHGIAAEISMLHATAGINTHRGAIFSLGLLVAASAACQAARAVPSQPSRSARKCAAGLPSSPAHHWMRTAPASARARHGVQGVREQAAAGYPLLREVALPTLRHALASDLPREAAMCQTLMQLIACVDDLNLLHRGGANGLRWAQQQARLPRCRRRLRARLAGTPAQHR
jgi:triphosphoribosyl-dephospho-CoA synthase